MSTDYQRILMLLDSLEGDERPALVQMYLERRALRKRLEDEKTVVLKRLGFIESELQDEKAGEIRLARIVLDMDTVTES